MAKNLLTDAKCKSATAGVSKKTGLPRKVNKLSDGEGLSLWIYDSGEKYWRYRYHFGGAEKGLSLGVYPKVSLADARKKADALRNQLQSGTDPGKARKEKKENIKLASENTFKAVAAEWYGRQVARWSASHADDVKRRLEANLYPSLGALPIAEIDAPKLLAAVRKTEAREAHDLAHRVLGVAGQVLRYGIATGKCSRDWSHDLKGALTPAIKGSQPAVAPKELPALLRAIAGYDGKQTRLALQLLALTFVRTGELIGATWAEFDIDGSMWAIPAMRTKMKREHLVPLSPAALAILAGLRAIAGDSPYVLPGRAGDKPISDNTCLFALYAIGYRGKMCGHGFRAIASTVLNESGLFSPDAIERQLGHAPKNQIRSAYNRALYLPERKKLMQWWSDYLDGLISNNVISINTA